MKHIEAINTKANKLILKFFIASMCFMVLMLIIPGDKEKVKQIPKETIKTVVETPILTPQQIESNKHDKWVEEQFSVGRGKLVMIIKDEMNDRDSFKYVSSTKSFEGDDLIITMTYKGKNVLGGMVEESIKAKVSYKDDSVTVIK